MSLVVVLTEPLGLPIGFPLVPFLNGILYRLVYNRKDAYFFVFCLMISPIEIKIKRNNISIVYSITILLSTVPSS